jgi:NADPH-dependent curcumin reductase CurA
LVTSPTTGNKASIHGGIVSRAVFEAVFPLLDAVARIPVCGLIAHYTTPKHPRRHGPHP